MQDAAQVVHGLGVGGHGAGVALGQHAGHVVFGGGLQPQGEAVAQQILEVVGVRHQPAGGGDDGFGLGTHRLFQGPALVTAVGQGAIQRVNFTGAAASQGFHPLGDFNEGPTQGLGQQAPQAGLARAAQANEGDVVATVDGLGPSGQQLGQGHAHFLQIGFAAPAEGLANEQPLGRRGGDVAHELGEAAAQGLRHFQQDEDGGVAGAALQVGQVPLGNLGGLGHGAPGEATPRPQHAQALAQGVQEGVAGGVVGGGHACTLMQVGQLFEILMVGNARF